MYRCVTMRTSWAPSTDRSQRRALRGPGATGRSAAASLLAVSWACSPAPAPAAKEPVSTATEFRPFVCGTHAADDEDGQARKRGEALTTTRSSSFLSVRRRAANQPATLALRGTACRHAQNPDACRAELSRLDGELYANRSCSAGCRGAYALTESEGNVVGHGDAKTLTKLLEPIDSGEEAWLVAQAHEDLPGSSCGDPEQSAFREVPGGYEIRYRYLQRQCEGQTPEVAEVVMRVSADGELREVRRGIFRSPPTPCVESTDQGNR